MPKIDPTLYQNKAGDDLTVSLTKLVGKPIKDLEGYISREFGLVLYRVVFDDGTYMFFEGAHDTAFLYTFNGGAQFTVDLEDLYDEDDE